MNGSITPVGDVDYYGVNGVNETWGFIALLETEGDGNITVFRSDGTTFLDSDTGSWEHGSGIALQSYIDNSDLHYLRISENGNDATIPTYTLRLYNTVVITQPEIEPNETAVTGTPSAFTHGGTLSTNDDVDCFAFQGRQGDTILLALDTTGPIDPILELRDAADNVLKSANFTFTGDNEFLEYTGLPTNGIYAYCVRLAAGSGGTNATYRVGLVRNGGLYFPTYQQKPTWLNPRPGNYALISDTLTFRLAMTNTSPIAIPGNINLSATYASSCLDFLDANPAPTAQSSGQVQWFGIGPDGLAPGEVYSVTVSLQAIDGCTDTLHQGTQIPYFLTGSSSETTYAILSNFTYLPVIRRP